MHFINDAYVIQMSGIVIANISPEFCTSRRLSYARHLRVRLSRLRRDTEPLIIRLGGPMKAPGLPEGSRPAAKTHSLVGTVPDRDTYFPGTEPSLQVVALHRPRGAKDMKALRACGPSLLLAFIYL
jgi:hypothetical protein